MHLSGNDLDRLIACVEEGGLSIDAIHRKSGNNLMMEAAGNGAQSIVRYLIKNGADVNYHNPINGNTVLHLARGIGLAQILGVPAKGNEVYLNWYFICV